MLAPSQMKVVTVREPEDDVALGGERQQLEQVGRVEGAVGLAHADEVGVDLAEARRMAAP